MQLKIRNLNIEIFTLLNNLLEIDDFTFPDQHDIEPESTLTRI